MKGKTWRVGVLKDTSKPMLGLHGLHVACRGLPNVEVVALVDSNPNDIAAKMAVTQAKRHYVDYREMLEKETPDIVILCSRHPFDHLPQIKAAAEHGCHVYCEKPLAGSLQEADEIVELVERHRIKLCVAHYARHSLAFLTMKRMIEEGAIGVPLSFLGRGKEDHRGGGEDLIVLGTHILDLQNFFFGPPLSVNAEVNADGRPIDKAGNNLTVEPIGPTAGDDIFACFRLANGVRGIFESRRGLLDASSGTVRMGVAVVGSKGILTMRFHDAALESPLRLSRSRGAPEDGPAFEDVPLKECREFPEAEPLDYALCGTHIPTARFFLEAHRLFFWDLLRAVVEDRQPHSNAEGARLVQEMIQGIYASQLAGGPVTFPLADRRHPLSGWKTGSRLG
ncbi:MAG: Gfo/Idh/MocA family oxidoreductase [Kiritimatiellae bacterium]|nr:Gfo/Idh/MocA family oxidoreductase [Kiritimatiellia bacterium]